MNTFSKYVINYPKITITICLFITLLFATRLPKITIDASIKGNFFPDFPAKLAVDKLENMFGGSEIVLLGIVSDNIYSPKTLKKIQRLTKEIEDMEETDTVTSLFTITDIISTEKGVEIRSLIEDIPETEEEVRVLRKRLRSNPMFWNNLISEDETVTVIIATMTPEAKDDIVYRKFQAIKERETKEALKEEGGGIRLIGSYPGSSSVEFYLGGIPINRALLSLDTQRDIKKLLSGGLLLMVILLYFSFRSLRGILLSFTVVMMSSICTLGLMGFLEKPITITDIMIPVMLIAIANDYNIHFIARYYKDMKAHLIKSSLSPLYERGESSLLLSTKGGILLSTKAIALKGINRLNTPILLTGITTIAGFSSLRIHTIPPIKNLGIFASFSIIAACIFSMTFVPAWLAILPTPKVLLRRRESKGWLEAILPKVMVFLMEHPWIPKLLVIASIFIASIFLVGIPQIIVHGDSMKHYEEEHPLVVSTNLLNKKLGGTTTIDIVFDGDMKNPEVLKKIQEVQEYMDSLPTIGKTISIIDFLKKMHQAMHKDDPVYYTIPETRDLVAQYLSLYSMSGEPDDFAHVVDGTYQKGHLIGRINVIGTAEIAKTVRDVEEYIAKLFMNVDIPKVESITGFSVLLKELLPLAFRGQMRCLVFALVIIFVVTALIFRSFVAGLFCVYPISVAVAIVFGLIGYQRIELSAIMATLFTILIGVGTDYTIHFLFHYREEIRSHERTPYEALEITLTTSGKGIIYNALSVIASFSVLMFSTFLPVYAFGWLLTLSILTCLISALILLPMAVLTFKPKFIFVFAERKKHYVLIPAVLKNAFVRAFLGSDKI